MIRCLKSLEIVDSVDLPIIGSPNQAKELAKLPTRIASRAAHVAAKRYLKSDSPPKAATYCIEVSFTMNLLTKAKNGNIRDKCGAKAADFDFSCIDGLTINTIATRHANHSVASHRLRYSQFLKDLSPLITCIFGILPAKCFALL